MTEPFTVRVERVKGNQKSLIPLPPKEGYNVGGPGWTMDEVMGLEQWIVKEWSGGGTYLFSITDAANQTMEWTQVFNYPEKQPPLLADLATPIPPVIQPVGMPGGGGSNLPWPPPAQQWQGLGMVPQAGPTPPPPMPWGMQPWGGGWGGGGGLPYGNGFATPAPAATPVASSRPSEIDTLKAENERLRLQQLEERHQAQVRAQEEAHQRALAALRDEIRNAKPTSPDPALLDKLEREREERLKAERERERAEWEAKIAAMQAANAKAPGSDEIALLRQKMEEDRRRYEEENRRRDEEARRREDERRRDDEIARLRESINAKPQGPDPMMLMFLEQMKASAAFAAESAKEQARAQADVVRELRSQMIQPMEMARLIKEAGSGQDQIIQSTVRTLNDVFGTAQQWFQSMMQQMGGGGESPAIRLIEGGMSQVKDMADRYFQTKAQTEVAKSNAQREAAKAAVAQAQAFSGQVMAAQQPALAPAAAASTPAPAATEQPSSGLNGASAPAATADPASAKLRKGGRTDAQWFGPAIDDVGALRELAGKFCTSLKTGAKNSDGLPDGLGPDQAAMFVLQAANVLRTQVREGKLPKDAVPAFSYLFENEMYPDLVEVLLPDVPAGYREDVLQFMFGLLEGKTPEQIIQATSSRNGAEAQPAV